MIIYKQELDHYVTMFVRFRYNNNIY